MDHISLIIVHYNTEHDTKECLQSLTKVRQHGFKLSIIVVDNASKILLREALPKTANNVEILRSDSNLGFTGGNNLGINYAIKQYNSEYIVLLNSDTLVEPDFLVKLYQMIKSQPKMGMVAPKIYFAKNSEFFPNSYTPSEKGKVLWYGGGTIDWANLTAFHRGTDEVDRGQFDLQVYSDFATGCCVIIGREVIETVGLLDDRYFLYLEDVDWSVRAQLHGFKIGFCPESIVWHKNAGSTGGAGSPVHQYYQTRNRIWFGWRYGSWRTKITVLRFSLRLLMTGNKIERQAVIDVATNSLGKRVL
jgi:GT2 family glycosyltransferase